MGEHSQVRRRGHPREDGKVPARHAVHSIHGRRQRLAAFAWPEPSGYGGIGAQNCLVALLGQPKMPQAHSLAHGCRPAATAGRSDCAQVGSIVPIVCRRQAARSRAAKVRILWALGEWEACFSASWTHAPLKPPKGPESASPIRVGQNRPAGGQGRERSKVEGRKRPPRRPGCRMRRARGAASAAL